MCSSIDATRVWSSRCGQASVEGAFLIPIILITLMLLIQPAILLYDRVVMQAAASEGCRLLATRSSASGDGQAYENFILRRLASIPEQANFHMHEGGCSYEVVLEGDESSPQIKVTIKNQVRLLPFFDGLAQAFGAADAQGCITQQVQVSMLAKEAWVSSSPLGLNPSGWVARWQ